MSQASAILADNQRCVGYERKVQSYTGPWAHPRSRTALEFYNLHKRSIGMSNFGVVLLGSSPGSGYVDDRLDGVCDASMAGCLKLTTST